MLENYILVLLQTRWSREVRRAVSADATTEMLQHEASLLRRILSGRPYRTLSRYSLL